MRTPSWLLGSVLIVGATSAWGNGQGLTVNAERADWPRWQARLQLNSDAALPSLATDPMGPGSALRARSAWLLGDYYVMRARFGEAGGLRLTSGLVVGARGNLFGPGAAPSLGENFTATWARNLAGVPAALEKSAEATLTWPYLGVGYSDTSLRGGWGFSADLGLAAQNAGAVRFGRAFGSQGLEDLVRDLRLTPVVQLGVSYRF
jgi:hypothetical protein